MSTVIAMIYNDEICLASDTMSTDHETGQKDELTIKQTTINNEIAIGFAGSGNIAQVLMGTLTNHKNAHIVSSLTFSEMPTVLDDIYQTHIAEKQYPDEETRHVSALIVGFNNHVPEIIRWDSTEATEIVRQSQPGNFTALILPPYDMTISACNEILLESANQNSQYGLKRIAANYFKTVASKSEFTSATATIWTHPAFGIIGML